ncbi:MAG: hypothetical protein E7130_02445 [Rikenellaceae bacterium]|nr:hypothetical protein [Rikenellaceae bacterium]MBQ3260714.1 hypothetical protein [Alistipes sp.]
MEIFKYKNGRYTLYWTAVYIIVIVLLAALLMQLYEGGYVSAWFGSFIAALVALMLMSVPRSIVVTEQTLQIRCLLDITEIRLSEISSIRAVSRKEMGWKFPIFGSFGFFGYFGHFIDFKRFRMVEIYATEWGNFVEIKTIYEDTYYVSCHERDRLISLLQERSKK